MSVCLSFYHFAHFIMPFLSVSAFRLISNLLIFFFFFHFSHLNSKNDASGQLVLFSQLSAEYPLRLRMETLCFVFSSTWLRFVLCLEAAFWGLGAGQSGTHSRPLSSLSSLRFFLFIPLVFSSLLSFAGLIIFLPPSPVYHSVRLSLYVHPSSLYLLSSSLHLLSSFLPFFLLSLPTPSLSTSPSTDQPSPILKGQRYKHAN